MTAPANQAARALRQAAARLMAQAASLDPLPVSDRPDGGGSLIHLTPGSSLVVSERERQISREGFDLEHDAGYRGNELAWAAFCYLERAAQDTVPQDDPAVPPVWPLSRARWRPKDTRIRNLAIAAALIAAEIDRLWADRERVTSGRGRAGAP